MFFFSIAVNTYFVYQLYLRSNRIRQNTFHISITMPNIIIPLLQEVVNILNQLFATAARSVCHGPATQKPQVIFLCTVQKYKSNTNSDYYVFVFCSDGQPPFWKQRRNTVAFLAFLGFFNVYTLRVNLSVGIVAMTTSTDTEVSA